MLRKSSKSVGYFNGHGAIAINNPSHICQQKEEKFRELEKNYKCLQKFIKIFLVLLFLMPQLKTKAQTQAPKVHWRRFDWVKQNPTILNSSASGQTFTRSESGSDWWYDIKTSYINGTKNGFPKISGDLPDGYVMSGYSTIRNYDNAESGGCNVANGALDQTLCKWIEIGEDPKAAQFYHTAAKISKDGLTMQWFHILPFRGNAYRVTQLADGSYIVVGDSKSTRTFDGTPIYYNPHPGHLQDYFCDGINLASNLDWAADSDPNLNLTTINSNFIGVTHISQNGDILWNFNYGFYDFLDLDIQTGKAHDAWDVQQSMPSGDIVIVGMSDLKAAAIRINPLTGELLGKRYVDAPLTNTLDGTLGNNSIGKTLICFNDANGIEKFIVGARAAVTILNSSNQERTRVYTAQFDVNFGYDQNLSTAANWFKWYFDLQTNPIAYDQQNINSIIYLKNTNQFVLGLMNNCGLCASASVSGNGEITTVTIDPIDGHWIQKYNCGQGGAFDFRAGLCNNIYPDDGGYGLVCSKLQSHPTRPDYNCNQTYNGVSYNVNLAAGTQTQCFDSDTYIAAFDANGTLKWENTYKDEMNESAPMLPPGNYKKQECMYSLVQTPDGGYMAAGNQSNNFDDNYLIKLFPENCADAITDYDITPNSLGGVPQYYEHPAYVIKHPLGNFNVFSELWNTSKKVKGTVVIPAGYELIISGLNTVISFDDSKQTGKDSKIIVLPGGKLRIENGARLTSDGNCVKGLWDGIEVWGTNNLSQDLQTVNLDANRPNELMSSNQGFVEVVGGSTIENAMKAVAAFNVEAFGTGDTYYNGGIIHAEDAKFINNRNDIDIAWYHDFNPATNAESNNKSFFKRCNFETNAPLANPGAVNEMICDMQLHLLYTDAHVHLWNVKGVSIEGCTFKTDLPAIAGKKPNYSKGIEAFDASFTCTVSGNTRNTFTNLKYGILNGSYNGSCDPAQFNTLNAPIAKIDRSDFVNCMRGIELDGTILTSINRCNFKITDTYGHDLYNTIDYQDYNMIHYGTLANVPVGIYTNGSLAYTIKDNEFNCELSYPNNWVVNYGMVNSNSSAYITAATKMNTYKNHFVHQQFEQSNLRLQSNCNQHNYTLYNDHYFWSVFDQLVDQGICSGNISSSETNIFNNDAVGNNYRDIHIDWYSANNFNYNSNPNYLPIYYNTVYVNTCQGGATFNDACPPNTYPRINGSQLSLYKSLLSSYKGLKKIIDGDNTEAMLDYIDKYQLGEIKNLPDSGKYILSDETLLALIDKLPPANWNDFETILLSNSPLNPRLLQIINASSNIPNPIKQSINTAQVGVSARSIIDKQLLGIEIEKGIALNELIAMYIDSAMVDSAMYILAADRSIGAKMLGLALDPYNHFGYNFNSDLNRDLALLTRTGLDPISIEQLKDFIAYFSTSSNGIAQTNNLSATNVNSLKQLTNVNSIDGMYSLVALAAANKATYGYNPKPIHIVNGYRESPPEANAEQPNLNITENKFDFKMQPNPANDRVQLVFDDILASKIEIMDLTGNLLFSSLLQGNKIEVSLSNFANGFYFVKAYNSVYGARVKQLIIVK